VMAHASPWRLRLAAHVPAGDELVPAYNMTVSALKAAFPLTPEGLRLQHFFDKHEQLLLPLTKREGIQLVGRASELRVSRTK
jgi:hypothetical protein